jgi:hypothetical protein
LLIAQRPLLVVIDRRVVALGADAIGNLAEDFITCDAWAARIIGNADLRGHAALLACIAAAGDGAAAIVGERAALPIVGRTRQRRAAAFAEADLGFCAALVATAAELVHTGAEWSLLVVGNGRVCAVAVVAVRDLADHGVAVAVGAALKAALETLATAAALPLGTAARHGPAAQIVEGAALALEIGAGQRRAAAASGADLGRRAALVAAAAELALLIAERTLLVVVDRGVIAIVVDALRVLAEPWLAFLRLAALLLGNAHASAAVLILAAAAVQIGEPASPWDGPALAGEVRAGLRQAATVAGADFGGNTTVVAVTAELALTVAERSLLVVGDVGVLAVAVVAVRDLADDIVAVAIDAALIAALEALVVAATLSRGAVALQVTAAAVGEGAALSLEVRAGLRNAAFFLAGADACTVLIAADALAALAVIGAGGVERLATGQIQSIGTFAFGVGLTVDRTATVERVMVAMTATVAGRLAVPSVPRRAVTDLVLVARTKLVGGSLNAVGLPVLPLLLVLAFALAFLMLPFGAGATAAVIAFIPVVIAVPATAALLARVAAFAFLGVGLAQPGEAGDRG